MLIICLLAVYRLNTYPLIHSGILQALLSAIALVPLLERFEAEHGTILSGAFFFGRKWAAIPRVERSSSELVT